MHSYDPKCYDLALSFLEDALAVQPPSEWVSELAREIQETIEMYIEDLPGGLKKQ